MKPRHLLRWPGSALLAGALLLGVLLLPASAPAQPAYKCTREGRVHYSDRPCEIDAKPVLAGAHPWPADTPEHWRYLGRNCRQLVEDLRRLRTLERSGGGEDTEGARSYALQQRHEHQCGTEEERAHRQLLDSAADEQVRRRSLEQQAQTQVESCLEMRRIRDLRRPTLATLPAGEKADFGRFEANFNRRCAGVLPR